MKNTENAAMPISAIVYWRFLPRRRSGNPAQVSHTRDIKPSSVPTRSLNQLCPDSNTAEMPADSICRTFQLKIPKMRIADGGAGNAGETPAVPAGRNRNSAKRGQPLALDRKNNLAPSLEWVNKGRSGNQRWRAGEADLDFRAWIRSRICKRFGACTGSHCGQDTGAVVPLRLR